MPLAGLAAVPVEFGATMAAGQRSQDRFNRGLDRFRSTVSPLVLTAVDTEPFTQMHSGDVWIRFGEIISENSYVGLTVGQFFVPEFGLREYRSDLAYLDLNWKFQISYGMFTYHYAERIDFFRPLRNWEWEGGFGFGFVPRAVVRAEGALISPSQYVPYSIKQSSSRGNIARLELGLRRSVTEHFFIRTGFRVTYAFIGELNGTINGGEGQFWYLRNSGITPLSTVNLIVTPTTQFDPDLGIVQASVLREPVDFPAGVTEWQFSVGVRF